MESPEFDIDRSIATAWQSFTERLADVVSVIDEGGSLRLGTLATDDDPAPFITFTHVEGEPDMVRVEAASNASLGLARQLSDKQVAEMREAGWQLPVDADGRPTGAFWMLRPQDESDVIAQLAAEALWSVYGVQHPVFLAPDQLAEVLTPTDDDASAPGGSDEFEPDDLAAHVPRNRAHLDQLINDELTQLFGHPPVRDADGDVTLRVGSSMVFLRTSAKGDEIVLFSALVHDVEGRSRATEVLNDLNAEARHGRFALVRDRVFVSLSVFAHPFVPAHLRQGLRIISSIADQIDDMLAEKLHGRTTFSSEE